MSNRDNTLFTPADVKAAVAQSLCDALNEITDNHNFDIINRLDIQHRTQCGGTIVRQHLTDQDRDDLADLTNNRKKWHVINAKSLPHDGSKETVATLQMGLLDYVNARPFGYIEEGDGSIIRPVMPKPGKEDSLTSSGRVNFNPHIDHGWARFSWEPNDGHRPVMPDFLSIGGHINPDRVATFFADPRDIIWLLSDFSRFALEQNEYTLPSPASVQPAKIATGIPIVTRGPDGLPVIRLNPRIICETQRARDALDELLHVIANDNLWAKVVLEPGDIVLARGTALHKRGNVPGIRELIAIYGRSLTTKTQFVSAANPNLERMG